MRRHSACAALAPAPVLDAWVPGGPLPIRFDGPDSRADGGRRQVEILEHEVMFERSIAGVRMRVAVPFTLYEGVTLDIGKREDGSIRLAVRLVHEDADLEVILFEAGDDQDVTAEWQYWANRFGLPLLIDDGHGGLAEPFARIGALLVGRPRQRRTPADFAARRPRFLTRRKTGRLTEAPTVHHEREIIARN
jgi:Family of unknown function (DUF6101)